jgi:hypothetical protein
MRALPKFLATVLFLGALAGAQTAPYAGGGIGANGLGLQSPYYNGDVGVDWGDLHPTFFEAEAGADTANPDGLNNGVTFRAHGVVMWRANPQWRLGGGIHFSDLFSSKYGRHYVWPTLGAMYERDWFRLNAQFLVPTSPDGLVGPLFDVRMHLKKKFYFRERVGIYWYVSPVNSSEPNPSRHASAVADFGVLYVFRGCGQSCR